MNYNIKYVKKYKSVIKKHNRSSFLTGMTRTIDFGRTIRAYDESIFDDVLAIESDWKAVGDDLRKAISDYNYAK